MKKFLVSLLFVLPLCCFAQKGTQGIGVNLGFETCLDITGYDDVLCCKNIPVSIEYHYNLTDRIRIAPHIGYIAADEMECFNTNVFEGGVSLHYFLNGVKRFRPYLMGGASIGGDNSTVYHDLVINRVPYPLGSKYNGLFYGVGFGVGLNCNIGANLSLQAEVLAHFSSLQDILSFGPNIGLTYVF